jgi:hypothetical protein
MRNKMNAEGASWTRGEAIFRIRKKANDLIIFHEGN